MENSIENQKSEVALKEEKILEFWQENKIFEKSVAKDAPKGKYVFYDGPPFATGTPHYGHILGSTVKDVIGRYQTMRGFSVPRRWGWDCHGLPIENIVEKSLKISGRKMIEEMGVEKFVEEARAKVLTYVAEWKKTVDRMGRWVDFENSYKTMDNSFIESVWWALSELQKKDLLYEGVRVLAYCSRCETPIANSEIAMDNSYKDITDISVYVKFKLTGEENTYLLAWTTTPWTLPGNTAIAVNKDVEYVEVEVPRFLDALTNKNVWGNPEIIRDFLVSPPPSSMSGKLILSGNDKYIFSSNLISKISGFFEKAGLTCRQVRKFKGSELVGKYYEPIFPYYKNSEVAKNPNIWKVWHADFVTTDMGTGIAHEAPAFGEDDMNLAKANGVPWIVHVDATGKFKDEVSDFAGLKVKPKDTEEDKDAHLRTDIEVIRYLEKNGALFAKEKIKHSYPHCYRCDTPLLYYALPSWFVNIQKAKKEILRTGEDVNWIPAYLKDGRYKNIVESAPDWTISRNRFWASPLPVWKSASGKTMFVNSLEDLKSKTKKSGNKYFVMRHGEADNNVLSLHSGKNFHSSHHLTEKGKNQVKDSIANYKKIKFDFIFSSPFLRAKETSEIVKNELSFDGDILCDERLAEIDIGIFDGKPLNTLDGFFVSEIEEFTKKVEGGECLNDIRQRVGNFFDEIDSKHRNKNILIVTHGDSSWMMFANFFGMSSKEALEYSKSNYLKNAEIRELNLISLPHNKNYELDLHRPYIDAITLVDEEGFEYKRVPEVLDCWFESGSMSFAQDHFPFENKNWHKENFPAGFVAEYIAQTRTWFYYMHVVSALLFGEAPFRNVVTTGTVLAEDGEKMSKSKNNFPDPSIIFDKYGVDALRFYLISSPLLKGEDFNFSEKSVQEIGSKIINRFSNVLAFYELYRDKNLETQFKQGESLLKFENVLDKWILTRLDAVVLAVTDGMEKYDLLSATKPFENFIEDLSVWYLRRSREKIKDGDKESKQVLYFVLKNLAKLLSPFTPFIAESVWLRLKNDDDRESVHLADWPESTKNFFDKDILDNMEMVRSVVSKALEIRQVNNIKVRQPLSELKASYLIPPEYEDLIKEEVNVKKVTYDSDLSQEVWLDTAISSELKEEGNYREFVRGLQDLRKKMNLVPQDIVSLSIETDENGKKILQKFEQELLKTASLSEINFNQNDGELFTVGELSFKLKIVS